jgi:hypothetical protein
VKVVTNSDLQGPKCPLYLYAFGTIKTIEVVGFRAVQKTVVDKRIRGVGVVVEYRASPGSQAELHREYRGGRSFGSYPGKLNAESRLKQSWIGDGWQRCGLCGGELGP